MSNRYLALSLCVFLALVLAVPAFGGPSNPIAHSAASVKKTASKALKTAKSAKKAANKAQTTADSAQSSANSAQSSANSAISKANAAQTTANTAETDAQTGITKANAAQATADSALAAANSKVSDAGQRVEGTAVAATGGTVLAGVTCPAGAKVTGGGYTLAGTDNDQALVTISSEFYNNNWIAQAKQQSGKAGTNWTVTAEGTCATSP